MEATKAAETEERCDTLTISNKLGLHARAAAKLVKLVEQYDAVVFLEKEGVLVDADSVLSLLTLECPMGTEVTVRAQGRESEAVMLAVVELIEKKFGEE